MKILSKTFTALAIVGWSLLLLIIIDTIIFNGKILTGLMTW